MMSPVSGWIALILLFVRDAKCNLYILMRVRRDDLPFDVHRQFAKRMVVPSDGGAALPHKKAPKFALRGHSLGMDYRSGGGETGERTQPVARDPHHCLLQLFKSAHFDLANTLP